MKRVVLTGCSGLIGKEAIKPLEEEGFEVITVNSKNCNLFDYNQVENFFLQYKPEYLLHFAWITGGDYLSNPINHEYVSASMNMLKVFKKNGGKRAVFAGTCFEYKFKDTPIKEDDPLAPASIYAKCKVELNSLASDYCRENQILFSWGRIFYVYGDNEKKGRLTQSIIEKVTNDEVVTVKFGQLIRDYMHSKDIARAFVKVLVSNLTGDVNICTGEGISLGDLAKRIAAKYNKEQLVQVFNEQTEQPLKIIGNNSKLMQVFTFCNKIV